MRVKVRKGTFRIENNRHKWRIREFCLLAKGEAGSSAVLKE